MVHNRINHSRQSQLASLFQVLILDLVLISDEHFLRRQHNRKREVAPACYSIFNVCTVCGRGWSKLITIYDNHNAACIHIVIQRHIVL